VDVLTVAVSVTEVAALTEELDKAREVVVAVGVGVVVPPPPEQPITEPVPASRIALKVNER
jgi:hypothetical protein